MCDEYGITSLAYIVNWQYKAQSESLSIKSTKSEGTAKALRIHLLIGQRGKGSKREGQREREEGTQLREKNTNLREFLFSYESIDKRFPPNRLKNLKTCFC